MPNITVRANARSLPTDRRTILRSVLAGAAASTALAFPAAAIAAASTGGDAEIIALSDEILRINALVEEITAKRIEPFDERFDEILYGGSECVTKESYEAAFAFSREVGREAAVGEVHALGEHNDVLFARMTSIPATTQPARAAKVRALIVHALGDSWRGAGDDLDYEEARKLLGEFAGMTEDDLAAI
jgi:hypothetical protein